MLKIEHVFFNYGSSEYNDFTLYTDFVPYKYSPEVYPLVGGREFRDSITSFKLRNYCTQNFTPQIGSEIHLVPDSAYAVQDVRNHYKLKREFDSGCCNVFSPIKSTKMKRVEYSHMIVSESHKILVMSQEFASRQNPVDHAEVFQRLKSQFPEIHDWDMARGTLIMHYFRVNPHYLSMILNTAKKPCIYYDDLPMSRNHLTPDLLCMLYSSAQEYGEASKENIRVILSSIAQTDWKEYPDTIKTLFEDVLRYRGQFYYMWRYAESEPKQIRELLTYQFPTRLLGQRFKHIKDRELMSSILEYILKVGDGKFVTLGTLKEKLTNSGVSEDLFLKFYGTMVKITPKRYEEEKNDSVS